MLRTRWVAPGTGARVSALRDALDLPYEDRTGRDWQTELAFTDGPTRLEGYDRERAVEALRREELIR